MKTILNVDDDANDVFLLQHAMKKAGVDNPLQVAADGQQAIDYLQGAGKFANRERFPYPCLVLMDLKLPYVMGLDVLRWIRSQPRTPLMVVMLSASAEDADILEAYHLGANAFLTKPSEASKLEDMVRAIKAFWLTHNTQPPEAITKPSPLFNLSQVRSRGAPPFEEPPLQRSGLSGAGFKGSNPFRVPIARPLLISDSQNIHSDASVAPILTKRQTEVLRLIADGYSTRRVADKLLVSIKTVEKHRQALMDKLDIHEIATLTRYAVSSGFVEPKPFAQLRGRAHRHSEKPLRRSAPHQIERTCFQAE
jgi:DNA-binding NarL/FixJ family response regulator